MNFTYIAPYKATLTIKRLGSGLHSCCSHFVYSSQRCYAFFFFFLTFSNLRPPDNYHGLSFQITLTQEPTKTPASALITLTARGTRATITVDTTPAIIREKHESLPQRRSMRFSHGHVMTLALMTKRLDFPTHFKRPRMTPMLLDTRFIPPSKRQEEKETRDRDKKLVPVAQHSEKK